MNPTEPTEDELRNLRSLWRKAELQKAEYQATGASYNMEVLRLQEKYDLQNITPFSESKESA